MFRSPNRNLIPCCPQKYKDYVKGKTVYIAAYYCGLDTARRIKSLIHPNYISMTSSNEWRSSSERITEVKMSRSDELFLSAPYDLWCTSEFEVL